MNTLNSLDIYSKFLQNWLDNFRNLFIFRASVEKSLRAQRRGENPRIRSCLRVTRCATSRPAMCRNCECDVDGSDGEPMPHIRYAHSEPRGCDVTSGLHAPGSYPPGQITYSLTSVNLTNKPPPPPPLIISFRAWPEIGLFYIPAILFSFAEFLSQFWETSICII